MEEKMSNSRGGIEGGKQQNGRKKFLIKVQLKR